MSIDRIHWGPGPWDGEPDELEWVTLVGYLGYLNRGSLHGGLNGYVAIPRGHSLFGRNYDELPPLKVHDGVSFSEPTPPGRKPEKGLWWFGFSGATGLDFMPAMRARFRQLGHEFPKLLDRVDRYRTVEFMRSEAERLAFQLLTRTKVPTS